MNTNLFWCIIGIIGGAIISVLISLFFYLKGLRRKRLTYTIYTSSISANDLFNDKEKVKYTLNKSDKIYSSIIIIKNTGNSIIRKHDIAQLSPLCFITTGQFFEYKDIILNLSPRIQIPHYDLLFIKNAEKCNYVKFDLDYMPQKSIIFFELSHSGKITFDGVIIDGKIIRQLELPPNFKYILITIISGSILGIIIGNFLFKI